MLPDRTNIVKRIRRERSKLFPANPKSLADLENIPREYRTTAQGEDFLQYDSYEDPEWQGGRVMVFFSNENLRRLFNSNYWFGDGTFKVSPSIFCKYLQSWQPLLSQQPLLSKTPKKGGKYSSHSTKFCRVLPKCKCYMECNICKI